MRANSRVGQPNWNVKKSLTETFCLDSLMTMPGGRPRRATTPDETAEAAAQMAVDRLVADAAISRRGRPATQLSGHLLAAVAAARIAGAAEHLARAYVAKAREAEGLTWEQIGDAFGTTRQSAHERFRS